MKLIVGLGNPGKEYSGTRHNMGFSVIDTIADEYSIKINKGKFKGVIGEGIISGQKTMLLKPLTYMNLSGESVKAVCDFYKIPVDALLIIYDDISIPIGGLRIREKGSAGGHNGIKSIIAHLGTDKFARIKLGVGKKPEGGDLVKHVLGKFKDDEKILIDDAIKRAGLAAVAIITEGCAKAMNDYNFIPRNDNKEV